MDTKTMEQTISRREEIMQRLFTDMQVERFNEIYYQARAERVKRSITLANIIAALAASGAFIGTLRTWPGVGPILLPLLMAVAAISAAVVPVLGMEEKFARLKQAGLGHAVAMDRLRALLRDLKLSEIEDIHTARESEIEAFQGALSALDEKPHDSLLRSCWERAEREFPSDKAWTLI